MRNHTRRSSSAADTAIPVALTILAGFVLAVGLFCWDFETTPGLDHTEHACAAISYMAVMGSFAGAMGVLLGLALLLIKD